MKFISSRRITLAVLAVIPGALLAACEAPTAQTRSEPATGTLQAELENGYPAGLGLDAVGSVGGDHCTGTLIGDRTILTAAHCFAAEEVGCIPFVPASYPVTFADDSGGSAQNSGSISVSRFVPDTNAFHGLSPAPCCATTTDYFVDSHADFTLLQLSANPTVSGHPVAAIPVMVSASAAQQLPGAPYVATFPASSTYPTFEAWAGSTTVLAQVGYGCGSTDDVPSGRHDRDAGLVTFELYKSNAAGNSSQCNQTYDLPGVTDGEEIYTVAADVPLASAPLGDGQKDPSGGIESWTCPGDSGGPLLAGKGDMPALRPSADLTALPPLGIRSVVGVTSRNYTSPTSHHPGSDFAATTSHQAGTWIATALRDNDHDGTPDFVDSTDSDGDGIPTNLDNCPTIYNTTQGDIDGDGFGDSCDPFPCATDLDFDFVPEACTVALAASPLCSASCTFVPDNCPNVPNNGQENCNALAESARGAVVMGDACDPVPCPQFAFISGTDPANPPSQLSFQRTAFTTGGVVHTVDTTVYTEPVSGLDMTLIGSHAATASVAPGVEMTVSVATTQTRHCSIRSNQNCTSTAANISDSLLGTNRAAESFATPWNRMDVNGVTEGHIGQLNYLTGISATASWNQPYDYADWISRFGTTWLAAPPVGVGTGPGSFWTHADTTVGMVTTADHNFHPLASNTAVAAAQLANHYENGPAVGATATSKSVLGGPAFVVHRVPYRPFDRDCFTCSATPIVDNTWLVDPPLVVTPDASQPNLTGGLMNSGVWSNLGGWYSSAVVATLQTGNVLGEQVEVANGSGQHHDVGVAAIVSGTGQSLVNYAYARGGKLVMASELPGGQPHAIVGGGAETDATVRPNFMPLPSRVGFITIYSRARNKVWVVGGTDPTTGLPVRSIGLPGPISLVPTSPAFTPYKVLAATYSPQINKLVLLDEGTDLLARLVLIDPDTGAAQIVKTWTRLRQYDQLWLALDVDGSILLEGSSASLNVWRVAKINLRSLHAPDVFGVDNIVNGTASLAMQPLVGELSYTFAENISGGWPVLNKMRSLPARTTPSWTLVGAML